ncbi:MAG TPA: DUF1501 domain-containing protein, partial [Blastocatellia bacterium]|nr:DUF1501 domain-containing protein [Blastocatellia bacterium]
MNERLEDHLLTRREMLERCGFGLGALALTSLQGFATPQSLKPHFAPKVKRVIHLFMNGGPSQV